MISLEDVKKLRELTGVGMMDAKQALEESGGDFQKATDILRLKGSAGATKRAHREAGNGLVEAYVHGGKIGVLVEVNCETDFVARTDEFKNFVHDVALQVAAADPMYVSPSDLPEEVIEKEKALFKSQAESQGKPAAVADKIVMGKLDKFYETVCLVRQPFIKDGSVTIERLLTDLMAKMGENVVIRRIVRWELGQSNEPSH